MGLYDRGVIAPGLAADLVLLDMERSLRDNATFADPAAAPKASTWVVVGGAVCMRDGQPTDARPGRVLRRRRAGG
jgi:N-acyl-D-amino-acid deacylase